VEEKGLRPAADSPARSLIPERKPLPEFVPEDKAAPAAADPFPDFPDLDSFPKRPAPKREIPKFERAPAEGDDPFEIPAKKPDDGLFGEDSL
jgi:hypothetical protein